MYVYNIVTLLKYFQKSLEIAFIFLNMVRTEKIIKRQINTNVFESPFGRINEVIAKTNDDWSPQEVAAFQGSDGH